MWAVRPMSNPSHAAFTRVASGSKVTTGTPHNRTHSRQQDGGRGEMQKATKIIFKGDSILYKGRVGCRLILIMN